MEYDEPHDERSSWEESRSPTPVQVIKDGVPEVAFTLRLEAEQSPAKQAWEAGVLGKGKNKYKERKREWCHQVIDMGQINLQSGFPPGEMRQVHFPTYGWRQ